MAARLNKRQTDSTRAKIQASQLINRLKNHVHALPELPKHLVKWLEKHEGELDKMDSEAVDDFYKIFDKLTIKMESTQIKAAEILLKKSLPDLSAVDVKGELETTSRLIINE